MYSKSDNIVALATYPALSAINIVRCSGSSIFTIYKKITKKNKKPKANSATLHLVYCSESGDLLDQSIITAYSQPKSYTGENMVEFSIHGGEVIAKRVIESLLFLGCRLASPGEFTYRAFINGKLDLLQAEAVNSLIKTNNIVCSDYSLKNLLGVLSKKINKIQSSLFNLITIVERELDFNEGEISFTEKELLEKQIKTIYDACTHITKNSFISEQKNSDVVVCIAGKPNVGKSSLFNCLLGDNRAIVNKVAGTTRDLIEKNLCLHKHNVSLVDTAGIRKSKNEIEREGVYKSTKMIEKADLVLYVDDKNPINNYKKLGLKAKNVVYILNKIDLINSHKQPKQVHLISCKKKRGITKLSTKLSTEIKVLTEAFYKSKQNLITIRQKDQLKLFLLKIKESLLVLKETDDMAVLASYLHEALSLLSEINSPAHDSGVVNNIFKEFCVGK